HVGDRVHLQARTARRKLDDQPFDAQQRLFRAAQMCRTASGHQATEPVPVEMASEPSSLTTGMPSAFSPAAMFFASAALPASLPPGKKHRYAWPGSSGSMSGGSSLTHCS